MIGAFRLGAQPVVKDQLATVPAGHARHPRCQQRGKEAEGQNGGDRILQPQTPVEAENRKQHHCQNEMRPACGPDANARDQKQLCCARCTGEQAHKKAHSRRPERHARPEQIPCPPVKRVRPESADTKRNGKGYQHGMDRVTGHRDFGFGAVKAAVFVDRVAQTATEPFGLGHDRLLSSGHQARSAALIKRVASRLVPLPVVALLAGCRGPLSTLEPMGPAASEIAQLWWAMLIGSALITLLVMGLVWRGFSRRGAEGPSEGFWTRWMGLGFTLTILVLVVGAGIRTGERMQPHPSADVVRVEAIARQWEWRFHQPGADGELIETRARLYIPAGRPVDVVIRSEDVIHAFWVPQLAGKMDAVPGRENVLRLQADAPGIYQGRSAEFSGVGFAGMVFEVVAWEGQPPAFMDKDPDEGTTE